MRLIHLAAYGGPYPGSFVPLVRATLDAAKDRGWAGEAIFSRVAAGRPWFAELAGDGYRVRLAPDRSRIGLARWLSSVIAEDRRPTVLHTHFTLYDVPAALAAARHREATVFWHVHSMPPAGRARRSRTRLKLAGPGRLVAAILCAAQEPAERLIATGAPRAQVHVVQNGIDVASFPLAGPSERAAARHALDLPEGAYVLLHFGWHWKIKGGDVFLDVVRRVAKRMDRPVIALCSQGGDTAREQARHLGIDNAVRVLEPLDDVQALYAAADVLVASSRSEVAPYAVFESLCSGTPVVASDLRGHRLVGRDVEACRVAPLDAEALASLVCQTLALPADVASTESVEARAWVRENASLDAWLRRVFDLYEAAVTPVSAQP